MGAGGCVSAAGLIADLRAIKDPAARDDVGLTWQADLAANGYNVWYVTTAAQVPFARQLDSPPAVAVAGCGVPSPSPAASCTDVGAVGRSSPAVFFYQVRVYCDPLNEGP
jgi:hypothetical protein